MMQKPPRTADETRSITWRTNRRTAFDDAGAVRRRLGGPRLAPQEAKEPNRLSHSVARSAAGDQTRLGERDVS